MAADDQKYNQPPASGAGPVDDSSTGAARAEDATVDGVRIDAQEDLAGLVAGEAGASASVDIPPHAPRSDRRGLTSEGTFRTGRLAGLGMGGAIWVLSWPVMLESFLNSFVGLTDTVLAAGLPNGEAATDAIGGASYLMWFVGLIIMALGIGATALISRAMGGGRVAAANAVLGQTLSLGVVLGLLVGLVLYLIAGPIAAMLSLSEEATPLFTGYLAIIASGTVFATLLFALTACSRGAGDSIRPLMAMVVRNVVNIIVSWCASGVTINMPDFLGGGGLAPPINLDMGVTGIALGTVVGDIAGMLIVLVMACSGTWGIRVKARRLKPHWVTISRLVRLGVPNFLETLGMWVGNFLLIVMVGWIALEQATPGLLGAHIVAIRIEAFSFLPGFAMGAAAATLAGQYLGAKRPDMAKRAVMWCTAIAAVIMTGFGLSFVFLNDTITGMFTQQPLHLERTPTLLLLCGLAQLPFALAIVFRSAMRGAGDVRWVMALTWTATYGVRLPLAYLFSGVDIPLHGSLERLLGTAVIENPSPFEYGLNGLWLGLTIELFVRGLLFTVRYMNGGWLRKRV